MRRTATLMAALAVAFAATAAPVRTATENFVANKIAEAVAAIPSPDYSTNNTALVETIQAKAPTPDLSPYLKHGEAIPTTGTVATVTSPNFMHFRPALSVGVWNDSIKPIVPDGSGSGAAFVFGDNVQTRKSNTMTLGVGALNTNAWSFIWNGDADRMYFPTMSSMSNPYATRYNGGFHVNPSVRSGMVNPLQNFWIGDTNLNDWIVTLSPPATWATLSGKPTNVSAFSNDAGYLTSFTETDPTISAWAKAPTKPTYTASEVGATTPEDVTAAIREQSLGGIWDETLQVWWTPRMRNGSLTYEATTNVNLNAEN